MVDNPSGEYGTSASQRAPGEPAAGRNWKNGLYRRAGRLTARAIALVYVGVGSLWILFSDRILDAVVLDPQRREHIQTVKGWAFVCVTGVLLYLLIRRGMAGMKRLEEELRATFEALSNAVVVVDAAGRVVEANRAAVELWGAKSKADLLAQATGRAVGFVLSNPDGTPIPVDGHPPLRALLGEAAHGFTATLRHRDGTRRNLEISSAPVRAEPDGPVELAVAVLHDVTERDQFEEMREEFLSIAAHEFKTPLAVIKAYAQLMLKRTGYSAGPLNIINRQVDRLNRLVHQLLEVSRLRLTDAVLRREPFDMEDLVANVVARMQRFQEGHRLSVHVGPAVQVEADRERLEQVLVSLIDNAVKFSPAGGEIEAAVARNDSEVVVSVRDHGLGIPADRQAHIFERFYRAHAEAGRGYSGLGIGLDISREIVALHGGRIWFESQPGHGSTFFFALPLAEHAKHIH